MHRNHFVGCGVGIALALAVVALSGGSAGSLGVLLAVLICPIAMVGAMWFLTGRPSSSHDARGIDSGAPPREPTRR
jgi:hypothetical protein